MCKYLNLTCYQPLIVTSTAGLECERKTQYKKPVSQSLMCYKKHADRTSEQSMRETSSSHMLLLLLLSSHRTWWVQDILGTEELCLIMLDRLRTSSGRNKYCGGNLRIEEEYYSKSSFLLFYLLVSCYFLSYKF